MNRNTFYQESGIDSGWLRRCYGSVRKLVCPRSVSRDWDVEAAETAANGPVEGMMLETTDIEKRSAHRTQSKDKDPEVHAIESHHVTAESNYQPPTSRTLASFTMKKDSCPRLLSDVENERMNKKIDKLIAAIDDRRPIHFEPDAQTGEVEIFADQEVIGQDKDEELGQDIAASHDSLGRAVRSVIDGRHMRSTNSLLYAESNDLWASTISESTTPNAWQREIAAANVRYALVNGGVDLIETPVRHPFRSWPVEEVRQGKPLMRNVSPIPLDFHKPLRTSTPSIHSHGSEQDASSPLFGKSCERILRDTYAQSPESTFQCESVEHSQLDDLASIPEPRDVPSPEAREANPSKSARKAFGVFQDDSNGVSLQTGTTKSTTRSKVLKDISNLRRPGYLQFNSFAKDAKSTDDQSGTAASADKSSRNFGSTFKAESRRAYISKKWPGLLDDLGNTRMAELPRLDGAARRRNEQAIGRPIDTSLYALSYVKGLAVDSPLAVTSTRQAHFDLALARLEGRALPPPPSPIQRYPDWAALYDRDVQSEGGYRPLPLFGPMPSKPVNPFVYRLRWRNSH